MLYATDTELAIWLGTPEPPANAVSLLRRASTLVADAVRGAVYRTDADGYPTDPAKTATLRDATLEQAAAWVAAGVEPGTLAADAGRTAVSKSLGSASVTYETNPAAQQARNQLAAGDQLTEAAVRILRVGGMLTTRVRGYRT